MPPKPEHLVGEPEPKPAEDYVRNFVDAPPAPPTPEVIHPEPEVKLFDPPEPMVQEPANDPADPGEPVTPVVTEEEVNSAS